LAFFPAIKSIDRYRQIEEASGTDFYHEVGFLTIRGPQCGNFRIFVSLRFYVKQFCGFLKFKICRFCHSRGCEFCSFGQFQPSKNEKMHKNSKFIACKYGKMADFALQKNLKIDFT